MEQHRAADAPAIRIVDDHGIGRAGEIAAAIGVACKTVANTSSQMKTKLGLSRTANLIRLSVERNRS